MPLTTSASPSTNALRGEAGAVEHMVGIGLGTLLEFIETYK
jgi:hypothetical protein